MNIAISGCCGFIGSLLCEYLLNRNYTVTGIDNFLYNNQYSVLHLLGNPKFKLIKANICHANSISEIIKSAEIIICCHGLVGMPICKKMPQMAWEVNAESIKNIVKILSKDQRLLIPNTNSGYGATDGTSECTEISPVKPISIYAQSKALGEEYALEHSNVVSLRLATVFGTSGRMRNDLLINNLFVKLYFDKQITLFEPHFMRNYCHIRDVIRGFGWAIYNGNGVYNFGNDDLNMSKLDLANKICDYLSIYRSKITIDETQEDEDKRNYVVSSNKIIKSGFKFEHSLEDGFNELSTICKIYDKKELLLMGNVVVS